jgi:hypothetical protein
MTYQRWILAAAAVMPAACSGAGDGEWAGTVRDSAGVAIVENPSAGTWTAETMPTVNETLRIGSADGAAEEQFGMIVGLDVDSQGRIYVLDQQARRVRVFAPDGTFSHEMGGSGSGPGELSPASAGLILTAGDTVLVPDMGQMRLTRYAPDGTALGSTPVNVADGIPLRWDIMPDRRIVQQSRPIQMQGAQGETAPPGAQAEATQADETPGENRPDLLLVRGADGAVLDTLMVLPAGQSFQLQRGGLTMRIFEPEPIWAVDGRGRIVFGINSEYSLRVHGDDGSLQRVITKPFVREPVTEADRTAFMRFIREAWSNAGMPPAQVDQLAQGIEFADHYPAFASLLGGPHGSIWVQHVRSAQQVAASGGEFSAMDVGASDWDVFDPDGRFLGMLSLPDRFQPMRVVEDRLYGVWRDDLDVQHVLVVQVVGEGQTFQGEAALGGL